MTSGKSTRDQRAAKAAAARRAAAKSEARRRNSIIGGVVIAVLVIAVGIGALVQSQRDATSTSSTGVPGGTSGSSNQSIVVGDAGAPVTVTMYEDFQCPICKDFETASGPTLKALADKGTVKLEYRPIAFLDRASSTQYSTRALNAVACAIDAKPSVFASFHDLLFANQPAENSAGLTDAKLADLATQAGAPDVSSCVDGKTFEGWTARVTDQASKDKVNGTPTVKVNGTQVTDTTPAGLTAAIEAAAK